MDLDDSGGGFFENFGAAGKIGGGGDFEDFGAAGKCAVVEKLGKFAVVGAEDGLHSCGLHAPVKSPAGSDALAGHTRGIENAGAKKGEDPGGSGRRAREPPAPGLTAKGEGAQGPAVEARPDRPEAEARASHMAQGPTPSFTAPPSSLASSSGYNAVGGSGVGGGNFGEFKHGDSLRAVWPHQPHFSSCSILPPVRSPCVVEFSRLPDETPIKPFLDSMKNFGSSEVLSSEAGSREGAKAKDAKVEAAKEYIITTASAAPVHGRLDSSKLFLALFTSVTDGCSVASRSRTRGRT